METEKKLEKCVECGSEHYELDLIASESDGLYCPQCYDENFFLCNDCSNETSLSNENSINDDYYVCNRCFENYRHCENCGEVPENEYYDDDLCNTCWDERHDDDRGSDGGERKYSDGDKFSKEKGRIYAVEIETNYDKISDRRGLFTLPEEMGISHDGSLGSRGVELQTPKLSGTKGDELLRKVTKHLNDNNFTVDKACGLHVHLDVADFYKVDKALLPNYKFLYPAMTPESIRYESRKNVDSIILNRIKTLLLFYLAFEPVIYSFMPMTRRTNRYCFPLSEFYHEQEISNCNTLEQLELLWYREQSQRAVENRKKEKYDNSRYAGYNFHSLFANKHLECRHHSGTQDYIKIRNWIDINIMILDNVMSGRIKMSELKAIKHAIDIKQKTKAFFDILGVNKNLQKYFLARQKKFCAGSVEKQKSCVE